MTYGRVCEVCVTCGRVCEVHRQKIADMLHRVAPLYFTDEEVDEVQESCLKECCCSKTPFKFSAFGINIELPKIPVGVAVLLFLVVLVVIIVIVVITRVT